MGRFFAREGLKPTRDGRGRLIDGFSVRKGLSSLEFLEQLNVSHFD
jgi:hypothetical protein